MLTRTIETDDGLQMLERLLESKTFPFTVSVADGKKRSTFQNRLQRKWVSEIADQMTDTFESAEDVRAYCKLHFGVPILRNENEAFRIEYDKIIKPMAYETKLKLMSEPFDFGVTRQMNTIQKKKYLDAVQKHFNERGIILTNPDDQGREAA